MGLRRHRRRRNGASDHGRVLTRGQPFSHGDSGRSARHLRNRGLRPFGDCNTAAHEGRYPRTFSNAHRAGHR